MEFLCSLNRLNHSSRARAMVVVARVRTRETGSSLKRRAPQVRDSNRAAFELVNYYTIAPRDNSVVRRGESANPWISARGQPFIYDLICLRKDGRSPT
jgi:hypothetical protein